MSENVRCIAVVLAAGVALRSALGLCVACLVFLERDQQENDLAYKDKGTNQSY